jgi:hypothetical protein
MYVFSLIIIASCLVGVCIGALFQWELHRRTLRLEMQQADLEDNLLNEKRKRAIKTRWDAQKPEDNLRAMLSTPKTAERYANDLMDENVPFS